MNRWSDYSKAEVQLARVLNGIALVFGVVSIFMLFVPYLLPASTFFVAPPFFFTNTIAGLGLLSVLSWFAAADVRRFRMMIYVVVGGLIIGGLACLVLYIRPLGLTQEMPLLFGFSVCGGLVLLLIVFLYRANAIATFWKPWIPAKPFNSWERIAQLVFGLFGLGSLGAAAASVLLPYLGAALLVGAPVNPFMIVGSAVKIGVLGLGALLVALDTRRYVHDIQMITVLIVGHAASFVVISLTWLFGLGMFGTYNLMFGGTALTTEQMMFGAWALDIVIIGVFLFLNNKLNYLLLNHIDFLSPTQFRALEAIAETLVAGETAERVPPHEIVLRTDSYLKSFRSHRLNLARLAVMGLQLSPLAWGKPPITYLNPAARQEFINTRFKQEVIVPTPLYRLLDEFVRQINILLLRLRGRTPDEANAALSFTGLLEAMLRFNMQLTYLGYYNNPDVWSKKEDGTGLGYVPFSQRPKEFNVIPRRPYPALDVMTPEVLERKGIDVISDVDVVIIGSGAAGAILAEQLADQGRRVLLLEKGLYVHPDDFKEDEIEMISRLYSDGALQISQSLRFTILQGSCVGGTTVVNNAVCFDTPRRVLDSWNARNSTPVIDVDRFYDSQKHVRERMRIQKITAGTRGSLDAVLNHGDSLLTAAVHRYFQNKAGGYKYDVIDANIVDCLGCGYCNIGCKYGRKLSMLDEVLPSAQSKHGAENFRIISEANVVHLNEDSGRIKEVIVKIQDKRQLVIRNPKTVIVSAGTIASSWLLMQSGIGQGRLPVGQGLSFNMGSPLHALFDHELNSYDGLQIAHYLALEDHPGFVYETWYNPPVAQALAMPGWLDTHFQNMQNYNRMAAVGVLVGTESNAHIVPALITGGPDVVFQPTSGDMNKLLDALVILGEIMFAGGALEVYASTRNYQSYRNGSAVISAQSEIDRLRDLVKHDYDILLGTGHPQGGNALGTSPQNSVVGADFKVHGYENLYMCDASVFPTSTTVNPQLTVMALAHYASQCIDA